MNKKAKYKLGCKTGGLMFRLKTGGEVDDIPKDISWKGMLHNQRIQDSKKRNEQIKNVYGYIFRKKSKTGNVTLQES